NVSVDLIFAVPGSTLADWRQDLARAIALGPSHVSAYALTFEENTPFHAWRRSGRLRAVDEDDDAAMAEHAAARLPAGTPATRSRAGRVPIARRRTIRRTGTARTTSASAPARTRSTRGPRMP